MLLRFVIRQNYAIFEIDTRNLDETLSQCYEMLPHEEYDMNICHGDELFLVPQTGHTTFVEIITETILWNNLFDYVLTIEFISK